MRNYILLSLLVAICTQGYYSTSTVGKYHVVMGFESVPQNPLHFMLKRAHTKHMHVKLFRTAHKLKSMPSQLVTPHPPSSAL